MHPSWRGTVLQCTSEETLPSLAPNKNLLYGQFSGWDDIVCALTASQEDIQELIRSCVRPENRSSRGMDLHVES